MVTVALTARWQKSLKFQDVAVTFSEDEWAQLVYTQRELYREVMLETYKDCVSLGLVVLNVDVIFQLERGEDPWTLDFQGTEEKEDPEYAPPGQKARPESQDSTQRLNVSKNPKSPNPSMGTIRKNGTRGCVFGPDKLEGRLEIRKENPPKEASMKSFSPREKRPGPPEKASRAGRNFDCILGGKTFYDPLSLSHHQRTHTGEKPHGRIAGEAIGFRSNLDEHPISHMKESPSECKKHQKAVYDQLTLTGHERAHEEKKSFTCNECGKTFSIRFSLAQHQRIHTGERPFQCTECGKSFREKAVLGRHKLTHIGERPYTCKECGKALSNRSSLIRHWQAHTGESSFECAECGKVFFDRSSLTQHRKIHREKPYKCTECEKGFIQKRLLVLHQRVHTGEKPYKCSLCGKAFSCKPSIVLHQRRHASQAAD